MGKIFGELLTTYALYTLNGAGLIVVFWTLASWYITCIYGWLAEGAFVVLTYIALKLIINAIANYINKKSIYYGNRSNWDNRKKDTE
jgi:hypothetical protein